MWDTTLIFVSVKVYLQIEFVAKLIIGDLLSVEGIHLSNVIIEKKKLKRGREYFSGYISNDRSQKTNIL